MVKIKKSQETNNKKQNQEIIINNKSWITQLQEENF